MLVRACGDSLRAECNECFNVSYSAAPNAIETNHLLFPRGEWTGSVTKKVVPCPPTVSNQILPRH